MVAAAVIGAAAIGAVGAGVAGSEAAGATQNATNASIAQQNKALSEQAQLSAPYRALGQSAIPTLQSLLGIAPPASQAPASPFAPMIPGATGGFPAGMGSLGGSLVPLGSAAARIGGASGLFTTPGGNASPIAPTGAAPGNSGASIEQTLQSMPGYQFTQEQGTQNTLNSAAAMGLGLSGNTLEALSRFNSGLADQTYQQEVGNLENVAGIGQAAAAGQAANIGNAANNISGALINQGNTLAGIDANTIAGITKSIGNASNQYAMQNTLSSLGSGSGYLPSDPAAYNTYLSGGPTMDAGGGYTYNIPGYP